MFVVSALFTFCFHTLVELQGLGETGFPFMKAMLTFPTDHAFPHVK